MELYKECTCNKSSCEPEAETRKGRDVPKVRKTIIMLYLLQGWEEEREMVISGEEASGRIVVFQRMLKTE